MMGTKANVICIGNYNDTLKDKLAYPPEFYDDTNSGSIVSTTMLSCSTSDQSEELAKALGVEIWDFNTHLIRPKKINWEALDVLYSRLDWVDDDAENFEVLIENKFMCVYQPNG